MTDPADLKQAGSAFQQAAVAFGGFAKWLEVFRDPQPEGKER